MKFNERLIELRKQKGLSQEELGDKLNVTRQTISKWELGQTTPEMDKLLEMSKFFNISIDELTKVVEEESKENIQENNNIQKNKVGVNWKPLLIILGSILVLILIAYVIAVSSLKRIGKNFFDFFGETTNVMVQQMPNMMNTFTNSIEEQAPAMGNFITESSNSMFDEYEKNENEYYNTFSNENNKKYEQKAAEMQAEAERKAAEMQAETARKAAELLKGI